VFANWLIERMQMKSYPIRIGHRVETELSLRPKSHGLASLTVKAVCRTCNGGWMSKLESWFQRAAGRLVEPTWPVLADAMVECLQSEGEKMATWCLKTALMIDQSGMSPKIPTSVASDLFAERLPSGLRVDLARIKSPGFSCLTAPGFVTKNGNQQIGWQSRKDGLAFQTVLQLNHLAIRVFCAPEANPAYVRPDLMLVRAYPAQRFSSINDFSYDSIEQFRANLLLVAGIPD
jgi:hypothetical protein